MIGREPVTTALVLCLIATLAHTRAYAQAWSADLSAGRTVYQPFAASAATRNLVGTVRYDAQQDRWVYGTLAVPLGNQAPFWDGVGAGGRFFLPGASVRRVTFGSDLEVHGFMFRDAFIEELGNGATTEAIPFASISAGQGNIELRGGWRGQRLAFAGATQNRNVFETGARATYDASFHLQGDVRWVRATEGLFPFVGAAAAFSPSSPVSLWAQAGKWLSSELDDGMWGLGLSIALGDRSSVWANMQQEAPDPLYWNARRRSWTIGLTRRLTRWPTPIRIMPATPAGEVLIRVATADAPPGEVSIAGSFNNWRPQPMRREGNEWTIRLSLAPGVYQYSFRSEGGQWFVPTSTPGRRDDGMGGHEAVLVVS